MLIVDDSRLSWIMIRTSINESCLDWHIPEAENGETALKFVAERLIDKATIDMNIPCMDGQIRGTGLRKRFHKAQLSMLTAKDHSSIRQKTEQARLDFIARPVTEDKILIFIKEGVM